MTSRIGYGARTAIMMAAALWPLQGALAQTPLTKKDMDALVAKVPEQSWYPPGYYDIRISAEAQIATFPTPRKWLLSPWYENDKMAYDLMDCSAEWIGEEKNYDEETGTETIVGDKFDPDSERYANVGLEVARIRSELERLGFPLAVYGDALLRFERGELAALPDPTQPESAAAESEPETDVAAEGDVGDGVGLEALRDAIETNRKAIAPKLPQVVIDGGCGAGGGGAPVIVRTSPPGGEVWMISAFVFNVCLRKKPNPWDRLACRWNEIETGADAGLSGRYIYQVRWPDGFERRGARDIYQDEEGGETTTVLLRKKGS